MALVMLLLYEILVVLGGSSSGMVVRNAPEAWMRNVLYFIGVPHYTISFAFMTGALIALPVFYRSGVRVSRGIVFGMLLESVFWGLFTGFAIRFFTVGLPLFSGGFSGSIPANLGLAIGAGLFEELLFRVLLTTFLLKTFKRLFRSALPSVVLSVLIASFLFSLAHYVGNMADDFTLYSFAFRFFAGIWFTTLYAVRGFAITCLSHSFYDIFVLILSP